jgi:hypothetical protein
VVDDPDSLSDPLLSAQQFICLPVHAFSSQKSNLTCTHMPADACHCADFESVGRWFESLQGCSILNSNMDRTRKNWH